LDGKSEAAAASGVLTGKEEKVSIKDRDTPVEVFEAIRLEPDGGGKP